MKTIIGENHRSVRLSALEINNLRQSIFSLDVTASLYLFGSRVDLTKRGGDIDILIISQEIQKKDFRQIRRNFVEVFGEQKIDIVKYDGIVQTPFVKMILPEAVQV